MRATKVILCEILEKYKPIKLAKYQKKYSTRASIGYLTIYYAKKLKILGNNLSNSIQLQ